MIRSPRTGPRDRRRRPGSPSPASWGRSRPAARSRSRRPGLARSAARRARTASSRPAGAHRGSPDRPYAARPGNRRSSLSHPLPNPERRNRRDRCYGSPVARIVELGCGPQPAEGTTIGLDLDISAGTRRSPATASTQMSCGRPPRRRGSANAAGSRPAPGGCMLAHRTRPTHLSHRPSGSHWGRDRRVDLFGTAAPGMAANPNATSIGGSRM